MNTSDHDDDDDVVKKSVDEKMNFFVMKNFHILCFYNEF